MKRWMAMLATVAVLAYWMSRREAVESSTESEASASGLPQEAMASVAPNHKSPRQQAPSAAHAQPRISLFDDVSGLAPKTIFESATGSGPTQLGVGGEDQDPRGPIAFASNASGRMAFADSINNRLQFRDASGRVVRNVELAPDTVLRHVAADERGNFHSLETTDDGKVVVRGFDESGNPQGRVVLKTQDSKIVHGTNSFRLEVGADGSRDLVSMDASYRVMADGSLRKLPGVAFKNDSDRFVRLDGTDASNRALSVVDGRGRVLSSVPLKERYQSVIAIFTDSRSQTHVQFEHTIESPPSVKGGDPVVTRMGIMKSYNSSGVKVGTARCDLGIDITMDHAFVPDPKGQDFQCGKIGNGKLEVARIASSSN